MTDKRKYRRLSLRPLPCRVYQDCQLIELSIGGAFVMTNKPLAKGSLITLEVTLPGQRTIRAVTQVERVGDYYNGAGERPCLGMGLSFADISPADRIAVTRFLTSVYEVSRGAIRVPTELPARVRVGQHWVGGLVREMGERSFYVATDVVTPIGTEVDVLLRLPSARVPLEARGVVVGIGGQGEDGEAEPEERGLRIELREASVKTRELMSAFIEEIRHAEGAEAAEGGS